MLSRFSHLRKAVAAFITPFLGLPLAEWLSGDKVWDASTVLSTLGVAIAAFIAAYYSPNKTA